MPSVILRVLLAALLTLAPVAAYADNAPDTPVVTGPNFGQVPIGQTLVTPAGGAQTTLGAALAAKGGSGTVTASPQYSVSVFPNAGSAAVVAGSSSITTDGNGNLNINGTVTPTVLNTAASQITAASGFTPFLPFANPSSVVIGSAVSAASGIPANTTVMNVSGGTASVTHTTQVPVAINGTQFPIESASGIFQGMLAYGTGLDGSALVAGVIGVSTPYTTVSPTAILGAQAVTVASGGNSCLGGSIIYDTTNPAVWPNGSPVWTTSTTTINTGVAAAAAVLSTDVVICYPDLMINGKANNAGTINSGTVLTLYPAIGMSASTSSLVTSGTAITFTPPTSNLQASGSVLGGYLNTGFSGLKINGANAVSVTNGLTYQNIPGADVLIGIGAGAALSPGDSLTTAVGWNALHSFVNGGSSESTAYGYGAGQLLVLGGYVNLFGVGPLFSCVYGCNHIVAIGGDTMRNALSMNAAIAIGNSAMLNNQGGYSVAVGEGAVMQGQASTFATTGIFNVAVGYSTMSSPNLTTASDDTVIGSNAGQRITTGNANLFAGFSAGTQETTGFNHVILGSQAGLVMNGANNNVFIGVASGVADTTGSANVLVGAHTGSHITTAANNLILGPSVASTTLATGLRNILIGISNFTDTASSSTNDTLQICDGNTNSTCWLTGINGATTNPQLTIPGSLVVGAATGGNEGAGTINAAQLYVNGVAVISAGQVSLGASASVANPNISGDLTTGLYTAGADLVDVAISGAKNTEWSANSVNHIGTDYIINLGGVQLAHFPSTDNTSGGGGSIAIGAGALSIQSTLTSAAYSNTAVGWHALNAPSMTNAALNNTAFGFGTGAAVTSGTGLTLIGKGAGAGTTSGFFTVALGDGAMAGAYTGNNSVVIGHAAGNAMTSAANVTIVGSSAGNAITTTINSLFGSMACQYCTTAARTAAFGYHTLQGVSGTPLLGSFNTAFGDSSGPILQGSAQQNTFVGYNTCTLCTTASGNTVVGSNVASTTLTTGASNILIGVNAAIDTSTSSGSNTIVIGGTGGSWVSVVGTNTQATQAMTMNGTLTFPNISTVGTIAGSVCMTSANLLLYESGATGCTISLEELKKNIVPVSSDEAVADVMALKPIAYEMKEGTRGRQLGFGAHQVHGVDPALSTFDGRGNLQAFDPNGILAELVATVQAQQQQILALKAGR